MSVARRQTRFRRQTRIGIRNLDLKEQPLLRIAIRRMDEMKLCEECSQSSLYKTTSGQNLFMHWLRRHKKDKSHSLMLRAATQSNCLNEPATCDSCQWKQFPRKNSLSRHCRRHLKHGQNYCCDRCGKEYSTKIDLNGHIYKSKAVCDICSSAMDTRYLSYHRKSHFGNIQSKNGLYFCDECSYRSINKFTLEIHLAVTHTSSKRLCLRHLRYETRPENQFAASPDQFPLRRIRVVVSCSKI